jgi:hypothetical protein
MWDWIRQLDRVLRGEATRATDLRSKTIEIPVAGLSVVIVVLGMIYGVCMGCYALFNRPIDQAILQLIASVDRRLCLRRHPDGLGPAALHRPPRRAGRVLSRGKLGQRLRRGCPTDLRDALPVVRNDSRITSGFSGPSPNLSPEG